MHVDYAGSLLEKMSLVLIDAHSKWIEVESVESMTTKTKVEKLRKLLSNHGIPEKNWYHTMGQYSPVKSLPILHNRIE